ncbi:DUF3107 domain-containing protein [Buchananella hordeovulneris]|uniref:Uncharacterized protein n=1 Tax=Buchananella hordeovulneris TaxID=52770 RepID=A0A1Q5PVP6_9ACTO|nr:DUF3107 domain-containing protein [Buchananella hordeovulneris]MDO5080706.1 DUF3107 domain-containing protein [Buchananella hordeovulneris]OKL51648.1 hypothetical protein BSZ40_05685 [Buchananella hordeovulneris]RRD42360.1 DUF3107 domain-containing protein [Buchananella hordeovulneris]RRD50848.1 DUF3107 domain-containing protein [Buchananella hordeovulneris]
MEITIGVKHVPQVVVFRTTEDMATVRAAVQAAIRDGQALVLPSARGGEVIVPSDEIGYVELDPSASRNVGFSL